MESQLDGLSVVGESAGLEESHVDKARNSVPELCSLVSTQ